MFNTFNQFSAGPLWQNGPVPGEIYNFPNNNVSSQDFRQHSRVPITTTTSVIAFKFDGGVIVTADVLGSYGSLAKFRNCPRILKVNDNILLGAGGDYADFQYVRDLVEQKIIDEECLDDGFKLKPKSLYCWLTRVLYNRRSKFDPFWNSFVVAGIQDGEPFLGTMDKLGTAYEDNSICTGYGSYMALPLVRSALEKTTELNETEAKELAHKCMEILYYRDARSYPKYQVGIITKDGVTIEGPVNVDENWTIAAMVQGY